MAELEIEYDGRLFFVQFDVVESYTDAPDEDAFYVADIHRIYEVVEVEDDNFAEVEVFEQFLSPDTKAHIQETCDAHCEDYFENEDYYS